MGKKYAHILAPLVVQGTVLKNRIGFPVAPVHFLVGNEDAPNDAYITFHAHLARAGAAYIHLNEWNVKTQHSVGGPDSLRMPFFDTDQPATWNYICQLCEAIHFYGSKVDMMLRVKLPDGYTLTGEPARPMPGETPSLRHDPLPKELMPQVIQSYLDRVRTYKEAGVDMICVDLDFVSHPGNVRTDEYSDDTLENRTRFTRELLTAVKREFGPGFLVETIVAGENDLYTTEELAQAAKLFEGLIDIFTLRERDIVESHPTGYTFAHVGDHKVTGFARKMKETGVKQVISINGGFQNPDEIEGYLAEGICDMVSVARGLFADPEWLNKVKEGRGEDITPCIWCNKCHGMGMKGPWLVACSVNPQMGLEHKVQRLEEPVKKQKKVAVVGGGPVGMRAAIYCAQRGHQVELFEKSDHLGGQTVYADAMAFKWPIRDHRNWVIAQLEKSAVKVTLNHAPLPEELEGAHFDVIIAATGAYPNIPNIPGLLEETGKLAPHVYTNDQVWAHPEELGERIVLIGASESGIETAIHLASKGKEVFALTRRGEIAEDAPRPHGITMTWINKDFGGDPRFACRPEWEKYPSLHGIVGATTTEVGQGYVKYVDSQGEEQIISCDEVVISGGVCKNVEPALALSNAAPDFYMIGDCSDHGGDLRKGYRQAWAVACTI